MKDKLSVTVKGAGNFLCGVSSPRDESLLFRQKGPKPFLPVRGPAGASAFVPNKMAQELALLKQPSPRSRFGTPAPPHTKARLPKRERSIHLRHRPFDVPYYLPNEFGAGLSFLTRSSPALGVAGPPARILPLGEGCLSGASS